MGVLSISVSNRRILVMIPDDFDSLRQLRSSVVLVEGMVNSGVLMGLVGSMAGEEKISRRSRLLKLSSWPCF